MISRGQTNVGDPRTVVQKGNKTFDITAGKVKEYTKNLRNPNSRYGDAVNFKKYETPKESEITQGADNGHKRTPTAGELKMLKK